MADVAIIPGHVVKARAIIRLWNENYESLAANELTFTLIAPATGSKPVVRNASQDQDGDWQVFSLRVESGLDVREEIYKLAAARKWTLRELSQRRATLEDVFVEITHSDQAETSI